jgi:hypothetical protein
MCSCGKVYIGQTGHHISTRITEHIRDTRLENQQSAVAEHSTATRHSIDFDKTEVIANISSYRPRIIRKAIEISKHPHNFNHEDDYRLSKAWLHLFSPKPPTLPSPQKGWSTITSPTLVVDEQPPLPSS